MISPTQPVLIHFRMVFLSPQLQFHQFHRPAGHGRVRTIRAQRHRPNGEDEPKLVLGWFWSNQLPRRHGRRPVSKCQFVSKHVLVVRFDSSGYGSGYVNRFADAARRIQACRTPCRPCQRRPYPDTPCMAYMPTLTPQTTPGLIGIYGIGDPPFGTCNLSALAVAAEDHMERGTVRPGLQSQIPSLLEVQILGTGWRLVLCEGFSHPIARRNRMSNVQCLEDMGFKPRSEQLQDVLA